MVASCDARSGQATSSTLVDKTVSVAPGGGAAEINFTASKGQRLTITMTSAPGVEPYGHLGTPDGAGEYVPKNETAKPGSNRGEWVVVQSGGHRLDVFDASNRGGTVTVKVETK